MRQRRIRIQHDSTGASVEVSGDVDVRTVPSLARKLRSLLLTNPSVQLDLSRVDSIDSRGISALVRAVEEGRAHRRHVHLCGASDAVRRSLHELQLDYLAAG